MARGEKVAPEYVVKTWKADETKERGKSKNRSEVRVGSVLEGAKALVKGLSALEDSSHIVAATITVADAPSEDGSLDW